MQEVGELFAKSYNVLKEQHGFSLLAVGPRCVQQAHQETHARRLSVKVLAVLFTLSNWAHLRVPWIVKLGEI